MSNINHVAIENLVSTIARTGKSSLHLTDVNIPTGVAQEDTTIACRNAEEAEAISSAFMRIAPFIFGNGETMVRRLKRWSLIRNVYLLPSGFSWQTAIVAVYVRDELQAQFEDRTTLAAKLMSAWNTVLCDPETVFPAPGK